ncbi:membrane protein insertion efficiency factor YidD [Mycolicibacterium sp.]|uniref:membrane protein insertion efficiency factor YidD n=1 Tax=Mycolicibacterium sp. TaxID=2320850 RepID=UPI001A1DC6A9|nr:membrane protein insertion efficiency factor YidD [Mycolicibacterium sp.]MBJ7337085.1 membrane protein insertion efficiency factor YidD [Mycolicibacterium sp.]
MKRGGLARGVIHVIELYRTMISPLRPPCCRFTPTCSEYAVDALREFGVVRGSWLSLVRLAKCGPWHRGGWDPIPERREMGSRLRAKSGAVVDGATLRSDSFV